MVHLGDDLFERADEALCRIAHSVAFISRAMTAARGLRRRYRQSINSTPGYTRRGRLRLSAR